LEKRAAELERQAAEAWVVYEQLQAEAHKVREQANEKAALEWQAGSPFVQLLMPNNAMPLVAAHLPQIMDK